MLSRLALMDVLDLRGGCRRSLAGRWNVSRDDAQLPPPRADHQQAPESLQRAQENEQATGSIAEWLATWNLCPSNRFGENDRSFKL